MVSLPCSGRPHRVRPGGAGTRALSPTRGSLCRSPGGERRNDREHSPTARHAQPTAAGPDPPASSRRAGLRGPPGGGVGGRPVVGGLLAADGARDDDDRLGRGEQDDLESLGHGHQSRRHRRVGHAFARGGDRAMAARGSDLARGAHGGRREAADPRRPLAGRHVARHHVLARHHERHGHRRGHAGRHRPRRRRRPDRPGVVRVRWGLAHHLRNRAVPRHGRRHWRCHRAAAAAPFRPRGGRSRAHRLPRRRLRRHERRAVGAGDDGREPLQHRGDAQGARALPGRRGARTRHLLLRRRDGERRGQHGHGHGGHSRDRPRHPHGQRRRHLAPGALRRRCLRARRPHLPGRRPDG